MKNDEQIESLEMRIAILLRWGVVGAGIFLACGILLHPAMGPNSFGSYHDYQQRSLGTYLSENNFSAPLLIAYAGLFWLISLPLIRVALTSFLFWRQKEKTLSMMALSVLGLLLISCALGLEI